MTPLGPARFVCTYCRRVYEGSAPDRCAGCGASDFGSRRILYADVSGLSLTDARCLVQHYRNWLDGKV